MSDASEAYFAGGGNDRKLYVQPSFYDALSGEFRYSGDPEYRVRTLWGLAHTAFTRGEVELEGSALGKVYYVARYSPSWAPHTAVDVDYNEYHGVLNKLSGVVVRPVDSTAEDLFFMENKGLLTIGSSSDDLYYSLAVGKSIITARQAVTEVVEEFYENSKRG